jgi:hypothetical protein
MGRRQLQQGQLHHRLRIGDKLLGRDPLSGWKAESAVLKVLKFGRQVTMLQQVHSHLAQSKPQWEH